MLGDVVKIGPSCGSPFNAGFLTHLYLIGTEDIVFVASPSGTSLSHPQRPLGIKPGATITQMVMKPKTATFSESKTETGDGISYQATVSLPIQGTVPALTNWIHAWMKRRFIVLMRDTMGQCYMAGSFDNGARLSWARNIGQTSGHLLAFTLMDWHPVQFIDIIDLDELFPDREFDYSFDLSFS